MQQSKQPFASFSKKTQIYIIWASKTSVWGLYYVNFYVLSFDLDVL